MQLRDTQIDNRWENGRQLPGKSVSIDTVIPTHGSAPADRPWLRGHRDHQPGKGRQDVALLQQHAHLGQISLHQGVLQCPVKEMAGISRYTTLGHQHYQGEHRAQAEPLHRSYRHTPSLTTATPSPAGTTQNAKYL